jgi:tetratricopeptide (TPR) repeat protein
MKPLLVLLFFGFSITNFSRAQSILVSEKEALDLAKRIEQTTNNGDPSVLSNLFDNATLIKHIKEKSTEASKSPEFIVGFSSTFKMADYGASIVKNIKDGSYKLMRCYQSNNRRHLLFRMFGVGGLNYHDYTLVKVRDAVKADDLFAYVTGEDVSLTMAKVLDEIVQGQSLSAMSDDAKALLKLKSLKKEKKFSDIIKLFNSLDKRYTNDRNMQIIYIEACRNVGVQEYKAALENYAILFPDAPNIHLMMIDVYVLNKQFDKAIETIDKVDGIIQGDPFLDFYRGNFYLNLEENKKAEAAYEKVFSYDPLVTYTIINLVISYLKENELEKAKDAIERYKKVAGYKKEYIELIYKNYPGLNQTAKS